MNTLEWEMDARKGHVGEMKFTWLIREIPSEVNRGKNGQSRIISCCG